MNLQNLILNFLGEYSAIIPELLLVGWGILTLFLSLSRFKNSIKSLYTVLFGQVFIFFISVFNLLANFSLPAHSILGGLLQSNLGIEVACLALQAITLVVAWMSKRSSQKNGTALPLEFYGLLSAATVALMFFVKSTSLVTMFVSLEASSLFITLLLVIGRPQFSKEALKFLLQSGLSAVVFLWGAALIYASIGTLQYHEISMHLTSVQNHGWALMGAGLILSSILFKLGLFPFSFWLPEIYETASYPIMAYLATASKFAASFALINLLHQPFEGFGYFYRSALAIILIMTLIWGALSAMHQKNVKCLLSLSGIVHTAFITSAILFNIINPNVITPIFFYFLVYISSVLLAIYCLIEMDITIPLLDNFKDIYARHPGFSMLMVFALASMAGLPPLGGFIAKFFVIYTGITLAQWPLVCAMILASIIALYYYLNLLFSILGKQGQAQEPIITEASMRIPTSTRIYTGFMLVIILGLGLFQASLGALLK